MTLMPAITVIVPFAAFISAFLLKEKLSLARWLGAAMILCGIVALRQ